MPGRISLTTRPVLIVNPRSDRSFANFVEQVARDGLDSTADLQVRLREQFPRAAVRARGLSGEDIQVWYVYRDGHWTGDRQESEEGNGVRSGGGPPGNR